ncbi:hypothetical protein V7S43_007391 [Phytophthora oleae]|uniref:Uncharacterized protein n=1 Tax=Phytophthora oleae TaxID=2107226 RepID=A0ABD3FQ88_9STRA
MVSLPDEEKVTYEIVGWSPASSARQQATQDSTCIGYRIASSQSLVAVSSRATWLNHSVQWVNVAVGQQCGDGKRVADDFTRLLLVRREDSVCWRVQRLGKYIDICNGSRRQERGGSCVALQKLFKRVSRTRVLYRWLRHEFASDEDRQRACRNASVFCWSFTDTAKNALFR